MKDTGMLQLTKWQHFRHFAIVFPLAAISFYGIIMILRKGNFNTEMLIIGAIFPVISTVYYIIQRRKLKFKQILRSVGYEKFKIAVEKSANELRWEILEINENIVVAKSKRNWKSWGELITIIREEDRIFINSICDPDQNPSVMSYGMNRRNVETFERALNDES